MSAMGAPRNQPPFDRWPARTRYLFAMGVLIVLLMIWQILETGTL